SESLTWPETRMILIAGQRSCTAWASINPSMLPGIWMSENSSEMSERDSRMASASSALTASTAVKPASSTMSTARRRNTISSSTTRTFVEDFAGVEDWVDAWDMSLQLSLEDAD